MNDEPIELKNNKLFLKVKKDGGNEVEIDLFVLIDNVSKINPDINCDGDNNIRNQMLRVKSGTLAATKMTEMHLVTGQGTKLSMVKSTFALTQALWDATNIDVSGKDETKVETTVVNVQPGQAPEVAGNEI
jgi:hypothetical protein